MWGQGAHPISPAPLPCPRGAPVLLATAGFSYICFIWWNCLCTDYTPKCSQHTASNIWQRAAAKQRVARPSRGHRRGAVGWKEVRWKAPNIAGSLLTPQQETGQRPRVSLTERWRGGNPAVLLLASSRSLKSNALELHLVSAHGCIGCMWD